MSSLNISLTFKVSLKVAYSFPNDCLKKKKGVSDGGISTDKLHILNLENYWGKVNLIKT